MTEQLIIRILPSASDLNQQLGISWCVFDSVKKQHEVWCHRTLKDLDDWLKTSWKKKHIKTSGMCTATLLLPGTLCALFKHKALFNKKHLHQALPYLAEELLIEDIETQHIIGDLDKKSNMLSIASINKELFGNILNLFYEVAINPTVVIPENLLIHADRGEPCYRLLFDENYIFVNTANELTQLVEASALELVIANLVANANEETQRATSEVEPPKKDGIEVKVISNQKLLGQHVEHVEKLLREHQKNCSVRSEATEINNLIFKKVIENLQTDSFIAKLNLRKGAFKCVHEANENWQRWRVPVYLLVGIIVLEIVSTIGKGYWFNHQANGFKREAASLYREAFPNQDVPSDIQDKLMSMVQFANKKEHLKSDFLILLKRVTNKIPSNHFDIESIEFNASQLFLEVVFNKNIQPVDVVKNLNQQHDIVASLLDTHSLSDNEVIAKIVVVLKGSH